MKHIRITTPKGKCYVVPESQNRAYYEQLNASIKDPKLQYRIEPAEDPAAPKAADIPATAGPNLRTSKSEVGQDAAPAGGEADNDLDKAVRVKGAGRAGAKNNNK
jgi:hypothetical protein